MSPFLDVDVHGMTRDEAKIAIKSTLEMADKSTYQVRVIHGFNHGTSLKQMVISSFKGHPLVKRVMPGKNQGITILVLREL